MGGNGMYMQHDWSPNAWAVLLLAMAIFVMVAMAVMLIAMSHTGGDNR